MKREIHVNITLFGKTLVLASSIFIAFSYVLMNTPRYSLYLLLLPFGILILSIIIASWFITRVRVSILEHIEIERILPERVYEDEEFEVEVIIRNMAGVGIYLSRVYDEYPSTTSIENGSNQFITLIPPRSEIRYKYTLKASAIGSHMFRDVYIYMKDFLGLFEVTLRDGEVVRNHVKCMARVSVETLTLGGRGLLLSGLTPTKIGGYGFEFKDIREYHPGDELRRIDWKASAKTRRLMIREYEKEVLSDIVIILDLSRNMFIGRLGSRKVDFAARTISYVISSIIPRGYRVGFLLLESQNHNIVPIRKASIKVYLDIMDLISSIPVEYSKGYEELEALDIDRILSSLNIRDKTLFILLSDLEDPKRSDYILNLAYLIRGLGHNIAIISPYTPLFEMELLKGEMAAIYRIEALKGLLKRRELKDRLIRSGIPIIDVGPDDMVPAILSGLERFRRLTPI